jgi:3-oxo-4,17-pregnadiene-20-carboxyl-CoA hydratase alpha subunit
MRTDVIPRFTEETAGFWQGAQQGEVRVEKCGGCGRLRFPPQPMCPKCNSPERSWEPVASTGALYTFAVIHGVPPEPQLAGERGHPFILGVVEVDGTDGVKMMTDIDGEWIERVSIGMPMKAIFETVTGEITLPRWVPSEE